MESNNHIEEAVTTDKVKQLKPIVFQPVLSPGTYEAEFAVKEKDLIFHFWPWGYHAADVRNTARPRFKKEFKATLEAMTTKVFGSHRITINDDSDMGAISIIAHGFGDNQFFHQLAVELCEELHKRFES